LLVRALGANSPGSSQPDAAWAPSPQQPNGSSSRRSGSISDWFPRCLGDAASTTQPVRSMRSVRSESSGSCAVSRWPVGGCSGVTHGALAVSITRRSSVCSKGTH